LKNLRAQAEGGELAARKNIELTLTQVIAAYYNVAAAEEALQIRRDALQISRERLQRIDKKAAYGQANKIDVLNAKVDFNADTTAYLNARLQLTEARRNLNLLLGRDVNQDYTVDTQVPFTTIASRDELKEGAFRNNASYLLAQSNLKQANYALRQSQSVYYPRLDVTSAYGHSQNEANLNIALDNPNRSLSAGLSLSLNLFNGFKNKIQTQNALISLKNQQILLDKARLSLEKDLDNAYTAYQNQRYILKLEQTNLDAAELNFKRSQELYNLGHLTATDFRAAQLNLIQARYRLSQAKFQAKTAETELLRLSGRLLVKTN
jgi:outer membrane protein